MRVRKQSAISNKVHEMDLPLTEDEFFLCHSKWKAGELIQNAFPMLNSAQREFIMTGSTQEEWDEMFDEDKESCVGDIANEKQGDE